MKVAFLATDMVEQVELTEPWTTVMQQGWQPELVSLQEGENSVLVKARSVGGQSAESAHKVTVDTKVKGASVDVPWK